MRLPTTAVTTLMRSLRDEVRQHHPAGRLILAVDGLDGAGTDDFADKLAEVFAEQGATAFRARIQDFFRPLAERGADTSAPEAAYLRAVDAATFRRVLVDPFRTASGAAFQLAAYDPRRDAPREAQWTTAPRDAVLIVDGPYLLQPELRGIWNWSVWLEVPPAVVFARRALREGSDPDPESPGNSTRRAADTRYLRDAGPRRSASAIVEFSDLSEPVRIFGDFC